MPRSALPALLFAARAGCGALRAEAGDLRLLCALLLEQNEEWQQQRRHMPLEAPRTPNDNQPARLSAVVSGARVQPEQDSRLVHHAPGRHRLLRTGVGAPRLLGGETAIMPYRIRWEGHGVYRRFFGVMTMKDFVDAYEEMRSDLRYEGIRYIISDYLEATPSDEFTEQSLRQFAELERLRYYDSPDTVQANVAADPRTLEYVRYYQKMHVSPYCMKDFPTVAEARHWIASNPRLGWRPPSP